MERDFVGYGQNIPKIVWPKKARLAINFILNYEEGSEQNVLDGDSESESYLTDLPGVCALKGGRQLSVESLFEYGSRTGVWRLLHLFDEFNIPITLFATGLALERNEPLCQKLRESPHEVAGHGYRWINYREVSKAVEQKHIDETLKTIQKLTGKQPIGWYTGRRSENTRKLIVDAGMKYDSDSYADDLPYWVPLENKSHLVIPYNLDANDFRYGTVPGWSSGEDFLYYLKSTFDCLYREGKLMTIGLHPRFSGRPGRAEVLRRFIEYIKQYKDLWICRREDVANLWCNK